MERFEPMKQKRKQSKSIILLFLFLFVIALSCSKDPENKEPTCTFGVIQNNMEVLKGTPVTFPVNAADEDGTISSVILSIDGEGYDTATIAPYLFTWETQNEALGSHQITANAISGDGHNASTEITANVVTYAEAVVPCPEAISISYAGHTYNTIKIGDQCWIRENMRVDTESSRFYDDNPENVSVYGKLYSWEAAVSVCPPGWKLPAYEDWCTLVQHVDGSAICQQDSDLGTDAGFKLKSKEGWLDDQSGSDQFGFKAIPGGFKLLAGNFTELGETAAFWTSSVAEGDFANFWSITSETTRITNNNAPKSEFFSVRCIKE